MALTHDLCYSIADVHLLFEYLASYASALQYFNFVTSIVICLVGLVGNAVVIYFIGFVMKKHKSKYWFLNLSIADFLGLLTLPFHAISAHKGTWTFGSYMCKIFLFSFHVNMYASIYILIALNIARVLSVAHPMFHLKFMSQRVSFRICLLIWFFTILFSLPMFYFGDEVKFGEGTICSFVNSETIGPIVNHGYNVSSVNITGDVLVSDLYTKIYFKHCYSGMCCGDEETLNFWNHWKLISKRFLIPFLITGYFFPLGVVIICNITIVVHVRKSKTVNPHRLYRIIFTIIVVYFITWTPIVISQILVFIAIHNMNLLTMISVLTFMPLLTTIAYLNSCLNPIMYVLIGGQMRTGLSDFISSIRNIYK